MGQKLSSFILDIPPKRQFLILMSLYLIFSSFSFSIISNFGNSSGNIKLGMCFNSVACFFIPAFILLKLVKRSKLADYWNFHIISMRSFLITVVIMICCFVIMNWLGQINKQLPMFNWMKENDSNESIKWQQYLKMSTPVPVFL